MAITTPVNPVPKLMDDGCTIIPNQGEGLHAYEKSIQAAEKERATSCVEKFRNLHGQDARKVEEIKKRLRMVPAHFKA